MTPFLESHRYNWKEDDKGCYIWSGATSGTNGRRPYARDPKTKKYVAVPRIVCEEAKGPCPEGEEVRHKCHTSLCVRDEHVHWGTHTQNVADTMK